MSGEIMSSRGAPALQTSITSAMGLPPAPLGRAPAFGNPYTHPLTYMGSGYSALPISITRPT